MSIILFLNNQPDALNIQIYSVIKLYMFRASSVPIIRSSLLYIRHWQVSCRFLMTASKQSQKTLNVSGIFFTHHQEFSTVHSVLVSFMQVFDDRFQAESEWNCTGKFHAGFWWPPNVRSKTPGDGQRRCPKHIEFYNRINLDNYCVLLVI